jgi:hypothetical protein
MGGLLLGEDTAGLPGYSLRRPGFVNSTEEEKRAKGQISVLIFSNSAI